MGYVYGPCTYGTSFGPYPGPYLSSGPVPYASCGSGFGFALIIVLLVVLLLIFGFWWYTSGICLDNFGPWSK